MAYNVLICDDERTLFQLLKFTYLQKIIIPLKRIQEKKLYEL